MGTFVAAAVVRLGMELPAPSKPIASGKWFLAILVLYGGAFYLANCRSRPFSTLGWSILTVFALLTVGGVVWGSRCSSSMESSDMPDAFTCPHCESALELPAAPSARPFLCARCGALLPNPDQPEAAPAVEPDPLLVHVVDDEDVRSWHPAVYQAVAVLGVMGTFVAAAVARLGMELLAPGGSLSSGYGLLASLCLYGVAFYLANCRSRPFSTLGWSILTVFALLTVGLVLGVVALSVWGIATLVKHGII